MTMQIAQFPVHTTCVTGFLYSVCATYADASEVKQAQQNEAIHAEWHAEFLRTHDG